MTDDILNHLRRLRMDLSNAQGKLTDVMQKIEGGAVKLSESPPPFEQVRRLILNGVIRDGIDLDAELAARSLTDPERLALRVLLDSRSVRHEMAVRSRPSD